ncbi:MAG: DUF1311 domain-containing protein [Gammaproteobacteria bacterium]|nr:MAG: DUF1311 domain-containing protein [Gammaproteobacteria bacterium]
MKKRSLILSLICVLPIISFATPNKIIADARANPGENAETDTRNAELSDSDAKLNEVYKKIMSQLSDEGKKSFQNAQREWIKMRDLDCKWAFSDIRDCLMDRTDNRTKELQATWFDNKDGKYTSLEDTK